MTAALKRSSAPHRPNRTTIGVPVVPPTPGKPASRYTVGKSVARRSAGKSVARHDADRSVVFPTASEPVLPQPASKVTPISESPRLRLEVPNRLQSRRQDRAATVVSLPVSPTADAQANTFSPPAPWWLRSLGILQRQLNLVTILLVVASAGVYASTSWLQERWSDTYSELEDLRQQEQQLVAYEEALKQQLANQARQKDAGLVPPTPEHVIFLDTAPPRPAPATAAIPPATAIAPAPLSY